MVRPGQAAVSSPGPQGSAARILAQIADVPFPSPELLPVIAEIFDGPAGESVPRAGLRGGVCDADGLEPDLLATLRALIPPQAAHLSGPFPGDAFLSHSVAVAVAARMIAASVEQTVSARAFVCGLLHDLGKAVLASCFPKAYGRVVRLVERDRAPVCAAEQEVFGLDHTVAGRRAALRWNLPRAVADCAWLHHQPPGAMPPGVIDERLVIVMHLADGLVRAEGVGFSGYVHPAGIEAAAARLGLSSDDLAAMLPRLREEWQRGMKRASALDVRAFRPEGGGSGHSRRRVGERDVQIRGRVFEAGARLAEGVNGSADGAAVCAAAAEVFAELLGADRVLVLSGGRGDGLVTAGACETEGRGRFDRVVAAPAGFDGAVDQSGRAGGASDPIACDEDAVEGLWRQCFGRSPDTALRVLPVRVHGERCGAIVAPDSATLREIMAHGEGEWGALLASLGSALASARVRAEAATMCEQVVDLNRRLHEAQAGAIRERSMAMIAETAAGAAHELNNPLAVISGRAQLLLRTGEDEDLVRQLRIIKEQADRASGIVLELMQFAKPPEPAPERVAVGAMLEDACQRWKARSGLLKQQLSVQTACPSAEAFADPAHVARIVDAVLANAVAAVSPEGGRIVVNSPSSATDETIRIVIEDNGRGMSREVLAHAFDPFFSSRPAGRGRGMGLSIAYRLAERNGGRLWLDSKPNVGTIVTIELPSAARR